MADLHRRDFLKVVGITTTTAAAGCSSDSARTLVPYIIPPEDLVPGNATWYATTCRECPSGCGLLAKNREGRVIKVEGNPSHPVNRGKLSALGQASLQGLYNPDRFQGPAVVGREGRWEPVAWAQAEGMFVKGISDILAKGRGERIAVLSDLVTGSLLELMSLWLRELGGGIHLRYEPLSHEPLREASGIVFGREVIPHFRIDRADFLISFGADFLGTWLSPVEYAGQFAQFRSPAQGEKGFFVYVGPRLSQTAASADLWIPVKPPDQRLVALGLLRQLLEEGRPAGVSEERRAMMAAATREWTLEAVCAETGVDPQLLRRVARRLSAARRPLALAGGVPWTDPAAVETAAAAFLLCGESDGGHDPLVDLNHPSSLSGTAGMEEMRAFTERMDRGEVDAVLIAGANPVFTLPGSWGVEKALKRVPLVASFSSAPDETTALAHMLLPSNTPLESWGDHEPRQGVAGLLQPVMGPLFRTRHLGDILLSTLKTLRPGVKYPWEHFHDYLREAWRRRWEEAGGPGTFEAFWQDSLRKGGLWEKGEPGNGKPPASGRKYVYPRGSGERNEKGFHFVAYPTVQFLDGRGANRPWLQELPDPVTQITWGSWAEIHPRTAAELGVERGDLIRIRSPHGSVEVAAYPFSGVAPDTLAMPVGQGHTAYGRFADPQAGHGLVLLAPGRTGQGGAAAVSGVTVEKLGPRIGMAHTDGSLYQQGRGIAQDISLEELRKAVGSGEGPFLRVPLAEHHDPHDDFYPPHGHVDYRWGMAVDLDRCIGCGACVVACNAENNVAIVGKRMVLEGREMQWLRIERYLEPQGPPLRFVPMLCQHCDQAPCESVCPVFAPHHSPEGINNQIYNRCIGTRFCSQNCPYKVRRFNWFTFTRPEPLHWQLNPDVTVRQKGVMEKCSFCVQRIKEAKNRARNEGRKVRDGEVVPACAQTCPTEALVFGSLMDPESRVSRLIRTPRAYQVLGHLNTKPAVVYLKRIVQEV